MIVEYAKKVPLNTRDKLLRKIAKKNSYIKTLNDAFRQAIDINRETSFVEADPIMFEPQRFQITIKANNHFIAEDRRNY